MYIEISTEIYSANLIYVTKILTHMMRTVALLIYTIPPQPTQRHTPTPKVTASCTATLLIELCVQEGVHFVLFSFNL